MSDTSVHLGAVSGRSRNFPLADGTHVELAALNISDLAMIEEEAAFYFRRALIETYVRNSDMLPESLRDQTILDAFRRAESITADLVPTTRVQSWMNNSIRGNMTVVWLSMRKSTPGLTFDQAAEKWSKHRADVGDAAATVTQLSEPTLGKKDPPPLATEAVGAAAGGLT